MKFSALPALPGNFKGKEAGFMLRQFMAEEDGMGVVEIVLIIVVLIGLVVVFKGQITSLINTLLGKMTTQANQI